MAEQTSEPRLHKHYFESVQPRLKEHFGFTNPNQIPRLEKVVLERGRGGGHQEPEAPR